MSKRKRQAEGWANAVKVFDDGLGGRVYRWVRRYAYARNGNLGNETPTYAWTVYQIRLGKDECDGSFSTLRAAKACLKR